LARNGTPSIRFIRSKKTVADINIDTLNVWGKGRDIEDTSYGFSDLDDMLAAAAKRQGREMIPNPRPEKGSIYRADNFEFSKVGLPSLYIGKNQHLLSRPDNAALRSDEYDLKDYHQPSDDVKPDWDLSGAVQDVDLLFEIVTRSPTPTNFRNGDRRANSNQSAMRC